MEKMVEITVLFNNVIHDLNTHLFLSLLLFSRRFSQEKSGL